MHANCLGMPSAVLDDICFLITYDHMVFLGNVRSWLPATPHTHPLSPFPAVSGALLRHGGS